MIAFGFRLPVAILQSDPFDVELKLVGRRVDSKSSLTIGCWLIRLSVVILLLAHTESKVNPTHVEPVRGTFDHRDNVAGDAFVLQLLIDLKTEVVVVMTAKDKIDPWHLFRNFSVTRHPHVCQRDDQRAPFLLSELFGVVCGCSFVVLVHKIALEVGEARDPFLLTDANEADFVASSFHDGLAETDADTLRAIERLVIRHEIGHDPLTGATVCG